MASKFYDTANAFNNTGSTVTLNGISVPPYSYAPPVPGYYQITVALLFTAASAPNVYIAGVFKNNNSWSAAQVPANGTNRISTVITTVMYLNGTGDYATAYAAPGVNTSTNYNSMGTNQDATYFQAALIRGA
jgi:hypothetical protein